MTSRFKILADLDIAERRQAQDGRIRRKYRDRVIDFRVNTLPSRFGEKVCLRLLDSGATQLGLDKLISDPDALALVRELGSKPFGMILVTGPTGSGKSTTLYSLLAERNDPGINISTVEDPIEYTLPGITQCQWPKVFDQLSIAMVEAGEAGGVLDEALTVSYTHLTLPTICSV